MHTRHDALPESELRQLFVANPDGSMGVANLESGVPDARVVDLPERGHYVFLTREADVVRSVNAFVDGLK
jgi:hypothetical protein